MAIIFSCVIAATKLQWNGRLEAFGFDVEYKAEWTSKIDMTCNRKPNLFIYILKVITNN